MKRAWLHEAAKFCAGLVTADFFMLWWLSMQSFNPAPFLGVPLTRDMIAPGMFIDFFLLLILVHYGWNVGKLPRVKERMYFLVAGVIFTIVCLAHVFRVMTGGDLILLGWSVPFLLSWIGILVSFYLAYASFHLAGRRK